MSRIDESLSFSNADTDVVRMWVAELMDAGAAASSVCRKMSSLRAMYDYMRAEGLVDANPLSGLKAPKRRKHLPAFVKESEMDALLEELGVIQDTLTHHDFYVIDAKVEEVARALGLMDIGLDKDVTDLSGGQRTKVLLGKLLLEKPDILLLDEPTNYLDVEHIEWLKRYLNEYENAFILISHDIPFLNSVINLIVIDKDDHFSITSIHNHSDHKVILLTSTYNNIADPSYP